MSQDPNRPLRRVAASDVAPAPDSHGLRGTFDGFDDAVIVVADDGTIVEANTAACELAGLAPHQVIGSPLAESLPAGIAYRDLRARVIEAGSARTTVRLRLPDGRIRSFRASARAHWRPNLHLAMLRDETGLARLEQAAAAGEQRFRAVFDALREPAILTAGDRILEANGPACLLLEQAASALRGQPAAALFIRHEDYAALRGELARSGKAAGSTRLRCGALERAAEFNAVSFPDTSWALLVLHPADPRPATALDHTGSQLMSLAFGELPTPAILCDAGTLGILAANKAAILDYGYAPEEFTRLSLSDLRPADSQPHACGAGESAPKPHDQGGLWRHRRHDGTLMDVEVDCQAIEFDDGRLALLICHDPAGGQATARSLPMSAELFESSSQAILITGPDGSIQLVNSAFSRITGYSEAEVAGRKPSMLSSGRHDRAFYERMWTEIREKGHWQGEIWNRRRTGEVYPEWLTISALRNSRGEVVRYVGMFSDISDRKAAEARIEYLAHYDPLTGLANRALLGDRFNLAIGQAKRSRRRVAVLILDLDRFKKVNDTLGHSAGDTVLQQTAQRLRGCLRQADFVARQGGDEFILLVNDIDMIHDAAHVAQKIIKTMARPIEVQGREIHITPSIGISIYPDDGTDVEVLLKNADIAMYQAKNAGRNNYQFFSQDMNESTFEHLAFESSLRRALDASEFILHYQPQVDLASGRMTGAEALIRWRHPDLGMVSPAQFIPVAEETGLIVPISNWVLRQACTQCVAWQAATGRPTQISVNVSSLQFRHRDFVELVTETLRRTGLDSGSLELELTESVVMHDADAVIAKLFALQEVGVRLAIDDFGTGYSSLSYLKRFPINRLKIDQSFVSDIGRNSDSEAIVEAIISMAHSLRLDTVAEGVETSEQLAFLRGRQCRHMQGYLFSRPLEPPALLKILTSDTRLAA
ncbi:MAG TPA: EAL domain-containing protein [Rhodocyclaceae bacterium]|nr:EAL domain-containing protein [Rhodocyclaceae bacterium]